MKRSFLPESELRRIVHHARHELPRAFQPDDKSAVDPRCVGSRVVQAAVKLGYGGLFGDLGGERFDPFPQKGRLAAAMGRLFPALDMNRSLGGVAGDIIDNNDSGQFDAAWDKVDETVDRERRVRFAKSRDGELVGVN